MIRIVDIIVYLELVVFVVYQEGYDNVGLIVGDVVQECMGVFICFDFMEVIIEEVIVKGCNFIVVYYFIVFKGLKCFMGCIYV